MFNHLLNFRRGRDISRFFARQMEICQLDGRTNSYYRYRSTLKALEDFAGGPVLLESITPQWLQACENYWRCNGKGPTCINIYMKTLKCVMNMCVREGAFPASRMPFGQGLYEIPAPQRRRMALTEEELQKIISYSGNAVMEKYRDLWLFSYLCNGINFRDMLFLRYRDIECGEITFVRSKTSRSCGRVVRAPFTSEMREIVRKHGNPPGSSPDTYIFKYAHEGMDSQEKTMLVRKVTSQCNKYLHKISQELGIKPFTTYSARHSFATALLRGGVNIKYISEALGHSNISMTENYLAGSEQSDRLQFSRILLHK